ncbi:hypothetical protein ANTRET_LOCUS898 [Anthophora retusa]
MRKYQNPRESSYDSSPICDSSASNVESEYTKSAATSVENWPRVMDTANSSRASYSENSSVSNISIEPIALAKTIDNTRALLKKKSLVQVINNYIKAGIEEGKRQAKKYIRKALSFGVKSGYLIPTDPEGQVIRVSPTLIESKKNDAESRKRRRNARKGVENSIPDNKVTRRPTPPWNVQKYREDTPKPEEPPRKKKKTSPSRNWPEKRPKKTYRKQPSEPVRRGKKKKMKRKLVDQLLNNTLTCNPSNVTLDRSEENLQEVRRTRSMHRQATVENKQDRRRRRTKSPRARNENQENSRKNRNESSDEDPDDSGKHSGNNENEVIMLGQRKSATNREDSSRRSNASPGNSAMKQIEGTLELPHDDNNDNTIEYVN